MARDARGHLSIHLHAHLPWVRHPGRRQVAEEEWLHDAVTETYLPVLRVLDRLADEGVPYRLSMTLSPTLVAMWRDELLVSRLSRRLDRLCDLADREVHRTRRDPVLQALALHHRAEVRELQAIFEGRHRRDLVGAFGRLEEDGRLEIVTGAATHAFLPLLQAHPEAVRAQVAVAVAHHRRHLGRPPPGIWLPECGYFPGLDAVLAEHDLRYFFVEAHGVAHATPRPRRGIHAPLFTPSGPAAFARDPEATRPVWGPDGGYAFDPAYRDFFRDIGWDLDAEQVRPWLGPGGRRRSLGVKYHRITGPSSEKELYDPWRARGRAASHAADFLSGRERQLEGLAAGTGGVRPVVVAPFDAEILGHGWYEGPAFLELVLRDAASGRRALRLSTPGDYLRENPEQQVATPALSSWGEGGYCATWLDGANDWIHRHLHEATGRMIALARDLPAPGPLARRALAQAARELMLAQASDWAFILKTGTVVDYAIRRTKEHLLRFHRLHDEVRARSIDEAWLARVESEDDLFPDVDHRIFSPAV